MRKKRDKDSDRIKMENELKVISANLTSIIESTDDLIWSVDGDYRITYFNSALKRYVEKNNNTHLKPGMHLSELASDDRAEVWSQFYRRAAREGRFSIDVPLDNRQECYHVNVNPIFKTARYAPYLSFAGISPSISGCRMKSSSSKPSLSCVLMNGRRSSGTLWRNWSRLHIRYRTI